jgi:DNA topoisomerase-1
MNEAIVVDDNSTFRVGTDDTGRFVVTVDAGGDVVEGKIAQALLDRGMAYYSPALGEPLVYATSLVARAVSGRITSLFPKSLGELEQASAAKTADKAYCATGPGGGKDNSCPPKRRMTGTMVGTDGVRTLANGKPLPDHIPRIPPAWTDVEVNLEKDGDLLVKGIDAKGRTQSVYSADHHARQAQLKFAKVAELRSKQKEIRKQIERDRKSDDPDVREAADVAMLIQATGLRPGSNSDTKAEKKAYGATTLEGRHIHVRNGKVTLKFTGKKGIDLEIPVEDPAVAKMLIKRKGEAGRKDPIFAVSDSSLREYTDTLDGGNFSPKDFRTAKGTRLAVDQISKMTAPTTQKEYKAAVKSVAKVVSENLGNTPTIALQSYIDPVVFAEWRIK